MDWSWGCLGVQPPHTKHSTCEGFGCVYERDSADPERRTLRPGASKFYHQPRDVRRQGVHDSQEEEGTGRGVAAQERAVHLAAQDRGQEEGKQEGRRTEGTAAEGTC